MALKVTGAPFNETHCRPSLWSTRRFGSPMFKDGSGCLPRIGKRASAFTATFIEDRHVVEGPRHVGMARAERLLPDRQCALEEHLRLFVLTLVSEHIREVGERSGHEGMA